LSALPPPPGIPVPMPAVAGVKNHRQLRLGQHLIERISDLIVGVEALQGRMQFESANTPMAIRTPGFAYSARAASGIDTGEGHDRCRCFQPRTRRTSSLGTGGRPVRRSSTEKDHAADLARAVVFGELLAAACGAGIAEIFLGRFVGGVAHSLGSMWT